MGEIGAKAAGVTLVRERAATRERAGLWLVKRGDAVLGYLTKYRDTPGETHPWKAYAGHGWSSCYLGSFYREDGGRAAAIRRILSPAP